MASAGVFSASAQAQAVFRNADLDVEKDYHRSNDSSTTDEEDKEGESTKLEKDEQIAHLARTFTSHSVHDADGHEYANPFIGSNNPTLDPANPNFNARAWTKTLIGITSRDPERYPKRVTGVSYKNLNVHGFGTPTDYQKSFGNTPLGLLSIFDKIRGKGKTKIQILANFDGLVKSGEMLVVLGRPGRSAHPIQSSIKQCTYTLKWLFNTPQNNCRRVGRLLYRREVRDQLPGNS